MSCTPPAPSIGAEIIYNLSMILGFVCNIPALSPPQSFRPPICGNHSLRCNAEMFTFSNLEFVLGVIRSSQIRCTCSTQHLKNHYKSQHMRAKAFAVWEDGKTGEVGFANETSITFTEGLVSSFVSCKRSFHRNMGGRKDWGGRICKRNLDHIY